MIKDTIATNLTKLPIGHSERLMSMQLPLKNQKYTTLISVLLQPSKQTLLIRRNSMLPFAVSDDKMFQKRTRSLCSEISTPW